MCCLILFLFLLFFSLAAHATEKIVVGSPLSALAADEMTKEERGKYYIPFSVCCLMQRRVQEKNSLCIGVTNLGFFFSVTNRNDVFLQKRRLYTSSKRH